jgi:hypothetical protein
MNLRTLSRYNLRQLAISQEYQIRFTKVKRIITQITGKRPSSELAFMAMIDEFLNLHCDSDFETPSEANGSGDDITLRTSSSNGGGHDRE